MLGGGCQLSSPTEDVTGVQDGGRRRVLPAPRTRLGTSSHAAIEFYRTQYYVCIGDKPIVICYANVFYGLVEFVFVIDVIIVNVFQVFDFNFFNMNQI